MQFAQEMSIHRWQPQTENHVNDNASPTNNITHTKMQTKGINVGMTSSYLKIHIFPTWKWCIFFRNISVTRNPYKYRPLKAHLSTLHPAWQVAGGNWLPHCIAIANPHPSKSSKAQSNTHICQPLGIAPVIGGINPIRHTPEMVD